MVKGVYGTGLRQKRAERDTLRKGTHTEREYT